MKSWGQAGRREHGSPLAEWERTGRSSAACAQVLSSSLLTTSWRTAWKASALSAGVSVSQGVGRSRPPWRRRASWCCSACSMPARSGFASTTASVSPGGGPTEGSSACGPAKVDASSERCSRSTCAATSGAPLALSSAAAAMASETPRECRSVARLAERPWPPPVRPPDARLPEAFGALARRGPPEPEDVKELGALPALAPEDRLPRLGLWLPSLLSLLAASADMGVEPSACFRASAGRRHVGHTVASRRVLAHCSKQAAWKTWEHLGRGRTLSPDLISSWQTVQTLPSGAISSVAAGAWLPAALPADCPAAPPEAAMPVPAPSATASTSCGATGVTTPPLGACEDSACACATSMPLSSSRTKARRAPQRYCRRTLCPPLGGRPRMLARASWKPSGRLPGPRSSSLSEDSMFPPWFGFIWAPSSVSMAPSPASPISLARRWARARSHLGFRRIRTRATRSWTRPAARPWTSRSETFTLSLMSCMRCKELIQSAARTITSTRAWAGLFLAQQAHIAQNLPLMSTQPQQTQRPISGPCGRTTPAGKYKATCNESKHIGSPM
mmetsp:Transcript_74234/g.240080  ORF Transcript_74234/g.240080 Transcript_74234/m.240080 type:complete len:559 (-) Transcript_74234:486-2162(-)